MRLLLASKTLGWKCLEMMAIEMALVKLPHQENNDKFEFKKIFIMQKTTGNMYGFIDRTYNPIRHPECSHKCSYCYMKGITRRFGKNTTMQLSQKELNTRLGSDKAIFVGSSTDMFAADVPKDWITKALDHLYAFPGNRYLLQTKNPARFMEFVNHPLFTDCRDSVVFCTTIESDLDYPDVSKAPSIGERIVAMQEIAALGFLTMVTAEPIMKFTDADSFASLIASVNPCQVNIGANTSRSVKLSEPSKVEVEALITALQSLGMNVHQKSNLSRLMS